MFNIGCKNKSSLLNRWCKVRVMVCIIFITITLTSCSQESSIDKNVIGMTDEKNDKLPEGDEEKIEVSMEDVIFIGMEEADKYYDNLRLTSVYSYDNDFNRDIEAGMDGKREWWYVNFANEQNNFVSILIIDGEVAYIEHFEQNGNNRLIDIEDVQMTSEEAVERAMEIGLTGGNPDNESHWVSGYNFKMSYASLTTSPNDYRIFLEVIGISPSGNFAHVDFDATSGELLLAEEKIEYSNGDIEWKNFNENIWHSKASTNTINVSQLNVLEMGNTSRSKINPYRLELGVHTGLKSGNGSTK